MTFRMGRVIPADLKKFVSQFKALKIQDFEVTGKWAGGFLRSGVCGQSEAAIRAPAPTAWAGVI